MFESLDDTMKRDDDQTSSKQERMIRYVVIATASVILFGGLIVGVQMLS